MRGLKICLHFKLWLPRLHIQVWIWCAIYWSTCFMCRYKSGVCAQK